MPVTNAAVERILSALAAVRPITSKKMFGGIGIYGDGVFFAVIDNDRLYFKVDGESQADYEPYHAEQWIIEGDKPQPMPYRELPAAVLAEPDLLGTFIESAITVSQRKKRKS
jgi:DNA transformation protein